MLSVGHEQHVFHDLLFDPCSLFLHVLFKANCVPLFSLIAVFPAADQSATHILLEIMFGVPNAICFM